MRVTLFLGAAAAVWGSPLSEAEAAPRRGGAGIHEGGFIYGSPALLAIPIGDDDFFELDPTWQWSFGGGYMFTPGRFFKAQLGGAFEHTIINLDNIDYSDVATNMIRIMPEARIGGGTNRIWGYGLIGPGLGITVVDPDQGDSDSDAGFVLQIGGGVQGVVWRNLVLGGELDFDLGFFDGDDNDGALDEDYEIHHLGLKFIVGWYF